jgi:formate hydrogenlyase subunit 3/multisubunit Na+/H+ antiporter MnhD subunit
MALINILLLIVFLAIVAVLLSKTKVKGIVTVTTVIIISCITGYVAFSSLLGHSYVLMLEGTVLFGPVRISVDALSAWFILTINFTMITGALYGFHYMKKYRLREAQLTLHWIAFMLAHFALIGICSVQNGFIFLLLWEIMALSVFTLVIFDNTKPETIKAGLNYLVQSHISIIFIMLGFIYVAFKTGSVSFEAIADFSMRQPPLAGTALFLCFFIGFAIKAGFVPFHTWLPYAHPAAPSHVSGVMSGVVIKIGIYGILRMLLLIRTDYAAIGYIVLFVSVVTGLYGVMLAIIQHDLKKLLAYHSIENIGIIGIGIGLGCIGLGTGNQLMAVLGFSGALLHTLNHSLFKSLLFYSAGNVLQVFHTVNLERLGGIIKKMPQTSLLFLAAAVAICGLPPLNGFISEFLIYGGLYNWLFSASLLSLVAIVFSIAALALIGGLAILCFTKAFSIVFLGNARQEHKHEIKETSFWQLFPMYMTVSLMVLIGLFPLFFINALQKPVGLFTGNPVFDSSFIKAGAIESLKTISLLSSCFILFVLVLIGLRKYVGRRKTTQIRPTWDCGYGQKNPRIQYTAASFARSYLKHAKPILDIEKDETEVTGIFPENKHYSTHSYDKIERVLIDLPLKLLNRIADLFLFLQNGQLQRYILYGIVFIASVIALPQIFNRIRLLINFLNNL